MGKREEQDEAVKVDMPRVEALVAIARISLFSLPLLPLLPTSSLSLSVPLFYIHGLPMELNTLFNLQASYLYLPITGFIGLCP